MKKSVSFDYSGRVALITGGADGIGRATALAFAESGANVAAPYTASKHGVIGLTKTAALEYAKCNIRVNAVCSGFIGTKLLEGVGITPANEIGQTIAGMHPLGRFGTAEEIAGVVLWLCSDQASFVTGHALLADGGYTAQ